jgi:HNH endonuclease
MAAADGVRTCSVEGCGGKFLARGYCSTHYSRFCRGQLIDSPVKGKMRSTELCSVEGCDRKYWSRGYCSSHLSRFYRGAPLDSLIGGIVRKKQSKCSVEGCVHRSRRFLNGFCQAHYTRNRMGQDLNAPIKGDADRINNNGYIRRLVPEGTVGAKCNTGGKKFWILEHRYVMQCHIGRPLGRRENVHHINGVKTDNRLENLELWSTSQPSGQRVEDKISWCIEFLHHYIDLLQQRGWSLTKV